MWGNVTLLNNGYAKKIQHANSAYSLQLLLLDSNENGGLIVTNVIWSHFLFGTPEKAAS